MVGEDVLVARRSEVGELVAEPAADAEQLAAPDVEHVAAGVERDEGSDGDPAGEHDARRADPALESLGVGTGTGTDGALGELPRARRRCGSLAERGVGHVLEVATEAEIEEHGCRDDRHDMVGFGADLEAAVALSQPPRHPVGGGEAVGATPGEAHGVDAIDEVDRVERLGLPGAGSPAADVDAADGPRRWEHDRGPGQPAAPAPLVVADMDAGDVGEVVVRPGQRARREVHGRVPPPRNRRAAST